MTIRASHIKACLKQLELCISMALICSVLLSTISRAEVLPFTDATFLPIPTGGVISNTTIITSYTTSQGTVTDLSHAISAQGNFDSPSGGGVDNVWGVGGTEIDGVAAALNLDVSTGVVNAGDTNDTTTIDIGSTGSLLSQFFFSQVITGGVPGNGNDFFLVELNGNDPITIVPLDSGGNPIGDFSLSIAVANWGGLSTGVDRIIQGLPGNTGVSPLAGVAFDFEDFTGTGTLTSLAGIGWSGTAGLDAMVVGVNSNLAPVVPEPRAICLTGIIIMSTVVCGVRLARHR